MNKKSKTNLIPRKLMSLPLLIVALLAIVAFAVVPSVRADQFDDQIAELNNANNHTQGQVNNLASQAASFQDLIARLQAEINQLQGQINENQNKQTDLERQIQEAQTELARQRSVLGEAIKTSYVDGHITTIEMLATSKNLSDFVDKEEYHTAVETKIQQTLVKITTLQNEMKVKKTEVEKLLVDQRSQQARLDGNRGEQSRLLSLNQQEQSSLNNQIASNSSKIGELKAQQRILNARYNIGSLKGDPNHGGYPSVWANAPQDSMLDYWGMYNRECVSYTAFKVHQAYTQGKTDRDMPYWGGIGDAKMWDDNARNEGIPVDSNPTPGSVAISNAGNWGHAMWVEQVGTINGQEAVYMSQYNSGYDGQYSEGWRYTTGLVFIHF